MHTLGTAYKYSNHLISFEFIFLTHLSLLENIMRL